MRSEFCLCSVLVIGSAVAECSTAQEWRSIIKNFSAGVICEQLPSIERRSVNFCLRRIACPWLLISFVLLLWRESRRLLLDIMLNDYCKRDLLISLGGAESVRSSCYFILFFCSIMPPWIAGIVILLS